MNQTRKEAGADPAKNNSSALRNPLPGGSGSGMLVLRWIVAFWPYVFIGVSVSGLAYLAVVGTR